MAAYGSQSSIPSYYNDAPDRPLFGESRPRVSKTQYQYFHFFTALHVMQMRYCEENSVRPSVCLSHACIVTKRKKNLSRFLYRTKDNLA